MIPRFLPHNTAKVLRTLGKRYAMTFDAITQETGLRPIEVSEALHDLKTNLETYIRHDGRVAYFLNPKGRRAYRQARTLGEFINDFMCDLVRFELRGVGR